MSEKIALAIDDAPANRDFLERLLGGAQFKVLGAGTGAAALQIADTLDHLTLAMVDMKLPDTNGLELAASLRERFPDSYLVFATILDERALMEQAFACGCNVFLVKPHGFMELFQRLMSMNIDEMRAGPPLVIDQYGPRVFKAATQQVPKVATQQVTKIDSAPTRKPLSIIRETE